MRILFMGTPDFAVASLRRLVADGHEVCGVFTQPDKPKNRGHKLVPTPVKEYALTQNIPVYQPEKMRDGTALELVQSLAPELTVVAAYGRILPEDILEAPKYGSINVHSSLLPKYRGAAPINWAILNGEPDHRRLHHVYGEGAGRRGRDPAEARDSHRPGGGRPGPDGPPGGAGGRGALSEAVAAIGDGTASRTPQDESRQTYASMLTQEMSPIDWTRSAREIDCQVRGLMPWPCAACGAGGPAVQDLPHRPRRRTARRPPARVLSAGKQGIQVACGDGMSLFSRSSRRRAGKRMSAAAYLLGHPISLLKSASVNIRGFLCPYGYGYYGYGDFLANNLYVLLLIPVMLLSTVGAVPGIRQLPAL